MTPSPGSSKLPLVWLFWLLSFSLCFAVLYYPQTARNGESFKQSAAPSDTSNFRINSSLTEADRQPYALLGPQGLLTSPDITAAVPAINNRGQVVVEDPGAADTLAAFRVPPAPQPGQLVTIVAPLKITPDAGAVKQKIAAKQQEICDDATFKAALAKFEVEVASKNFSQRANQLPDGGLGALIKKYARQHGVDARLVWAVIRNESGFNPQAVSPKGAMGLMQLIPSTAALMGVSDPFDIEQNINGGVRYLKLCLAKFNNNVVYALAAYNAGPDNVSKYQGCPPFAETRNYVLKVMRDYTGKNIDIPLPSLALLKARPGGKTGLSAKSTATQVAEAPQESGLDWNVPGAKFKVAGPTWKLPARPTIILGKIPDAVRQNPEVTRLLAKQAARKLLP